jgi:Na+/proline symporter
MLGLMVAGMVFATASSLNTTLNMMAAVTTNDIYKAMRPESTEKQLINIARISTLLFGIAAMAIALLVPSFGGIVNVVFTVAALTGVAMFGPPIWSLFSKRIKGRQMISVTVISLIVNLSAKFLMPVLTGYELNRANEFAVGSLVPISLLIIVELWLKVKNASKEQYLLYNSKYGQIAEVEVDETDTKDQRFGVRVISTAALVTSSLIAIIGAFSSEGRWLMIGLGLGIMLLALTILLKFRNK